MSDGETPTATEPAPEAEQPALPPLDESPFEIQPLDIETKSFDPHDIETRDGD